MVPPGRIGFEGNDTYLQVVSKAARSLGLEDIPSHQLLLVILNSLVKDKKLPSGKPWTLGNYTNGFSGPQARAKRTFGIYVLEETDYSSSDDELEIF